MSAVPTSSLSSFALRHRPAGAPRQARPQQITHFYTITSRSLPAHGGLQVSPVCLPLCDNFSPIICCNKHAMGRVTFTLIVCTQRGSLPPHHGSKVSPIVSNFLLPFLATVCCFFSLSQPGPNYRLDTAVKTSMRRCPLTFLVSVGEQTGDLWIWEEMCRDVYSESSRSRYHVSTEESGFHCCTVSRSVQI